MVTRKVKKRGAGSAEWGVKFAIHSPRPIPQTRLFGSISTKDFGRGQSLKMRIFLLFCDKFEPFLPHFHPFRVIPRSSASYFLELNSLDSADLLGSSTVKIVPIPNSLSTSIRPPCDWTSWRVIASPRPLPVPPARDRERLPFQKRSKI